METHDSGGAFLYALAFGLAAGVATGLIFGFGITFLLLGAGAVLGLIALGALMHTWFDYAHHKKMFLAAIALAALVLGGVRADFFLFKESQETITHFADKSTVVGTVSSDPEVSGAHLQAEVAVVSVNDMPARGTLLAFLPTQTTLAYGQPVVVQGVLAAPSSFVGDNGNVFDYPNYLRVQGVSMLLSSAKLTSAQPASTSLFGTLYFIKHAFDASIERLLPEPAASLLEGIMLGERHGLPKAITELFVVAGLIHIVILSGYSMSVVSEGILRALGFLSKRWQMLLAAVCMILFVLMTGAAATTVRACAMALVALLARYMHRQALALRSLAAVAAGMVLYNPPLILGDASFVVSVLATFGLIVFAPSIERLLHRVPRRFEMRSIITSTIAVQIFALPALLYFTGNISYLSVPANLLVLPLLPFVMIGGLASGLLGFINVVLAQVPALITDALLQWILLVVHVTNAVPFASSTLTAFPLWLVVVIYIPLTGMALYLLQSSSRKLISPGT